MSDSTTTAPTPEQDVIAFPVRMAFCCIICVIIVLTLGDNSMFWAVILRTKRLQTGGNILLLCLSMTDLVVAVSSMPFTAYNVFYGSMQLSPAVCRVTGYFFGLCGIATIFTLVVVTVNRYIRICHTSKYDRCCRMYGIVLSVTGVWVVSAVMAAPLFPGWSEVPYTPETLVCGVACVKPMYVCLTKFLVVLLLPLTLMLALYVQIFRHFRDSSRRIKAATESRGVTPSLTEELAQEDRLHQQNESNQQGPSFFRRISRPSESRILTAGDQTRLSQNETGDEGTGGDITDPAHAMQFRRGVDDTQPRSPKEVFSRVTEVNETASGGKMKSADDNKIQETIKTAGTPVTVKERQTIEKSPTTYSFLGSRLARYFLCVSDAEDQPLSQKPLCCSVMSAKQIQWRDEEVRVSTSIGLIIAAYVLSYIPALVTSSLKLSGTYIPKEVSVFSLILFYANSFYNPIIYGVRNTEIRAAYKQLWVDIKNTCCRSAVN